MEISELRLWNLIQDEACIPQKVSAIQGNGYIHFLGFSHLTDISKCKGIPLNEEWLTKFGFHSKYKSVHVQWTYLTKSPDANYHIFELGQKSDEDENGASIPQEQVFYYDYKIDVKYVHQLQNLFFALTGEELTIK